MKHKWITMGSGGLPMGAIPPTRCEVCKLVVHGVWRKKLSEHGCPGHYFIAGSLLDQAEWEQSHTVELNSEAAEGITPERQALMDIEEYMENFDGTRCAFSDIQKIIDEVLYEDK